VKGDCLHVCAHVMETIGCAREHGEVEVDLGTCRHDQRQLRIGRSFSLYATALSR
jgi:hypothetical protein